MPQTTLEFEPMPTGAQHVHYSPKTRDYWQGDPPNNAQQALDRVAAGTTIAWPTVSTDNALARWNGTTGKVLQNSVVICDDNGNITGVGNPEAFGGYGRTFLLMGA